MANYMLHCCATVLCQPVSQPAKMSYKKCLEFENNGWPYDFSVEADMLAGHLLCSHVYEPVWFFDYMSRSCPFDFIFLCCIIFLHICLLFLSSYYLLPYYVLFYVHLFLATFGVVLFLIVITCIACGHCPFSGI